MVFSEITQRITLSRLLIFSLIDFMVFPEIPLKIVRRKV